MKLVRLDLGNNDSIVLRFPDDKNPEDYLNFGDEGYNLCQVLSAMNITNNIIGYKDLGEVSKNDTIIDFRHFRDNEE